jgi:hypothetical protein
MRSNRLVTILSMLVLSGFALPVHAADRMRAGQWVGTTIVGGKTYPNASCISQSDADAMNGDATSIEAYLKKVIPPEACTITAVKVDGTQVVYTASCGGGAPKVVTTVYHGNSSEGTDTTGGKTEAKLVGACK